jgi:hypothetical protein
VRLALKLVKSADKAFQKCFVKYLGGYSQMQNFMKVSNLVKKLEKLYPQKVITRRILQKIRKTLEIFYIFAKHVL